MPIASSPVLAVVTWRQDQAAHVACSCMSAMRRDQRRSGAPARRHVDMLRPSGHVPRQAAVFYSTACVLGAKRAKAKRARCCSPRLKSSSPGDIYTCAPHLPHPISRQNLLLVMSTLLMVVASDIFTARAARHGADGASWPPMPRNLRAYLSSSNHRQRFLTA